MATTTTNFGWDIPQSTDLVKDGATAIAALGQDIDTALVDLKGGTTGQILAKASNTDLDYSWITNDVGDITAVTAGTGISGGGTSGAVTITNSMATAIDAKGDLIAGTGADAFSRLAAGNNGETLVADSSASTGLRYQSNFAAGKNKIINGDMNIWQRGTSITVPIANNIYSGTDRFCFSRNGTSSVITCSRQAFTPGTAPVAGYESNYFMRLNQTVAGSGMTYNETQYKIEDVTTFAGQTVTFSFWAKADSPRTVPQVVLIQNFGSGGSSQVNTNIMTSLSITTSWQRFTGTITLPSISGKTIGTSSFLEIDMQLFMNTTFTFDTWGWQLEAASVATAFQTATGTIQGELAACQRYYWRIQTGAGNTRYITSLGSTSTTDLYGSIANPVPMRTNAPSSVDFSALSITEPNTTLRAVTAITVSSAFSSPMASGALVQVASGLTGNVWYGLQNTSASGYIGFSAEL